MHTRNPSQPFGVDILMCYRREEPSIQWLGLSSADVRSLPPSLHVTFQPFTERDDKLMTKLLRYDVVIADDSMKESLQQMQQHRYIYTHVCAYTEYIYRRVRILHACMYR